MAISYQFRAEKTWLSRKNKKAIEDILNWRIPLIEERLIVQTTLVLGTAPDVKRLRKDNMFVDGWVPKTDVAMLAFDEERISTDEDAWLQDFLTTVDHEVFHNAQYQNGRSFRNFSFPADFISEGSATAFEIEMGATPRQHITVLKTEKDWREAASFAKEYWHGVRPYHRESWLWGRIETPEHMKILNKGKKEPSARPLMHRARTGYSFAFAVFSGYCNRVRKLPSDLLQVTADEVLKLWADDVLVLAPQGPYRAMINELSHRRGYTLTPEAKAVRCG